MLALADACAARPKAELALTICNRPHAPGIAAARARGLPVQVLDHTDYASREDFEAALQRALVAAKTELVCAAGFMRLFSPAFVARWHNRLLNIHPSLLPHFPGLNTHQRALKAGMQESGCSVHFIRARMDAGPHSGASQSADKAAGHARAAGAARARRGASRLCAGFGFAVGQQAGHVRRAALFARARGRAAAFCAAAAQARISSSRKKSVISCCALAGLSEPCTAFSQMELA